MNFYRIPAHDICMGDPAPFGQRWEARVPLPLKDVGDIGKALHTRYGDFRPGDLVNVCAFDSLQWNHLLEVAAFRVASVDHNEVAVVAVGKPVAVPKPDPKVEADAASNLVIAQNKNAFEVRDERGNVIDVFVDRKQAVDFIAAATVKKAAA